MKDWITGIAPEKLTRHVLERDVQNACIRFARSSGAYCRKFSSPGNRSVPDYLILYNGVVRFVEFKRPGAFCTQKQRDEHQAIQDAGGEVKVIRSLHEFREWFAR